MTVALVVSTYELGGRPTAVTAVAGALRAAGHQVLTCDLSLEAWPTEALATADCLCLSVPMHTALRLGEEVARRARVERPGIPVFFYGLYASVARDAGLLQSDDEAIDRDEAATLTALCDRLSGSNAPSPSRRPTVPDHRGLPALSCYATFDLASERRLVATVATTVGCNHRCRHCPVPVVHDGRSTAVDLAVVEEEVAALVAEGARHVHFADPDFLNRPRHAERVMDALSGAHPELTFDATIKVSHILRFPALLATFAGQGLVSVISAFESTSDEVLGRLDKGHTAADLHRCVELLRTVGIEPRPSLLPFTPWTTRNDLVELLDFVASHDLIPNVDTVQYSIRLLLPPRSLLLSEQDAVLAAALEPPAAGAPRIAISWRSPDPLLDGLAVQLAGLAEEIGERGLSATEGYELVRRQVFDALRITDPGAPALVVVPGPPSDARGAIAESWFCCAEPTLNQLSRVGVGGEPVFLGATVARR